MKVLVLNCGSSSIKYRLFDMPGTELLAKGVVQRIGEAESEAGQTAGERSMTLHEAVKDHQAALRMMERMLTDGKNGAIGRLSEIGACGHRVVHGGEAFTGSVRITADVEKAIADHFELAPLHNPPNLAGIREAKRALPGVPQVACFDTAFHQTIPEVAYLYALPREVYERHRVRRYGFHGTSHRYVARRAAVLLGRQKYGVNLVTCHLGNGCSLSAVRNGRSVDTSMGMTPLEGVPMGTRTGDLDPAIVFYLEKRGYSKEDLDRMFNQQSGFLGLSGVSNDVRSLEKKVDEGHEQAALALEVFAYRMKKYIGSYLAVLNGCDAIVFTGGIGENAVRVRSRILENMDALGIKLDPVKNAAVVGCEGRIEAGASEIKLLVIPTNEEAAIANDTYRIANAGRE